MRRDDERRQRIVGAGVAVVGGVVVVSGIVAGRVRGVWRT